MSDSHEWDDQEAALLRLEAFCIHGEDDAKVDPLDVAVLLQALRECRAHVAQARREALEEAARCAEVIADHYAACASQEEREGDPYGDDGPRMFSDWETGARRCAEDIRALAQKEADRE